MIGVFGSRVEVVETIVEAVRSMNELLDQELRLFDR